VSAFYNEIDPHAARWLRNLIAKGLIADGRVEEKSIAQLSACMLVEQSGGNGGGGRRLRGSAHTQAHFFAGIGAWSYALRLAGWPDDLPVWTGSCPCQPFSVAGKSGGFSDERHLWPEWYKLIAIEKPPVVFGEQVASPDGLKWLDSVFADLEGAGYACAAADLAAASVGAPHQRQRLYFVAVANDDGTGLGRERGARLRRERLSSQRHHADGRGEACGVVQDDAASLGRERRRAGEADGGALEAPSAGSPRSAARDSCAAGVALGDASSAGGGRDARADACAEAQGEREKSGISRRERDLAFPPGAGGRVARSGSGRGILSASGKSFWDGCDWIPCIDGKARPVESGTFALVDGASYRMDAGGALAGKSRSGLLKGYGNAIVAELAAEFIRAVIDVLILEDQDDG
jgi:DNA (cytosine-5)-methyltransferase 1